MSQFISDFVGQGELFMAAVAVFLAATIMYLLLALKVGGEKLRLVAAIVSVIGLGIATALLAVRWIDAGRPPFKTIHETLLLAAWCMSLLYVVIERFYRIAWVGFLTSLSIFGVYFAAVLETDVEVVNLPAALQSVWFVPHVIVYFVGYAALFFGFVAALLYLARPDTVLDIKTSANTSKAMNYAGFMHRAILLGFLLLTLGLVMGAIWAKEAWGDYWVWDPKENWALVSWLVYAIYLHLRFNKGFGDRGASIVSILGFAAIIFTYLGMNMLPTAEQSAHIYQ